MTSPAETVEEDGDNPLQLFIRTQQQSPPPIEQIAVAGEKGESSEWLHRVGWAEHLQGFNYKEARRLAEPGTENKPVLQAMLEVLERVMGQARATARAGKVGRGLGGGCG